MRPVYGTLQNAQGHRVQVRQATVARALAEGAAAAEALADSARVQAKTLSDLRSLRAHWWVRLGLALRIVR